MHSSLVVTAPLHPPSPLLELHRVWRGLGFALDWQAFALAETQDTGKPIEDSEGEIDEAIDYLRCTSRLQRS